MTTLFVDTFYFLAMANPHDAAHEQAVRLSLRPVDRFLTTDYVLLETADALAAPRERPKFLELLQALRNASMTTTILPCSRELFDRGVVLYGRREDKGWSLTDCISFVVMNDHGLTEALTGDVHFRQAGFVPLFASS